VTIKNGQTGSAGRSAAQWGGIAASILIAGFLLFEGVWFATLRGTGHGIPDREAHMGRWALAEGASFAGMLLCDALAAVLFTRQGYHRRDVTESVFGSVIQQGSPWRKAFLGFIFAVGATIAVAFGLALI